MLQPLLISHIMCNIGTYYYNDTAIVDTSLVLYNTDNSPSYEFSSSLDKLFLPIFVESFWCSLCALCGSI